MKISNGSMVFSLYKKDLMAVKFESLMILLFIAGAYFYSAFKILQDWHPYVILGVSATLFFLVMFAVFIGTFTSVRKEWSNNTIYLMMSLPLGGKSIFLAKLLAVMTQLLVLGGITLGIGLLLSFYFVDREILLQVFGALSNQELIESLLKVSFLGFLGVIQMILVVFFSTMMGYLFKRFSRLITFVTFIVTNILLTKVSAESTGWFFSVQDHFHNFLTQTSSMNNIFMGGFIPTAFFAFQVILALAFSALLFFLTTAIYDRKVEL